MISQCPVCQATYEPPIPVCVGTVFLPHNPVDTVNHAQGIEADITSRHPCDNTSHYIITCTECDLGGDPVPADHCDAIATLHLMLNPTHQPVAHRAPEPL